MIVARCASPGGHAPARVKRRRYSCWRSEIMTLCFRGMRHSVRSARTQRGAIESSPQAHADWSVKPIPLQIVLFERGDPRVGESIGPGPEGSKALHARRAPERGKEIRTHSRQTGPREERIDFARSPCNVAFLGIVKS